jgi:small conductance mechanosensitive channel
MVKRVKLAFDDNPDAVPDASDAAPAKKSNGKVTAEKPTPTRQ